MSKKKPLKTYSENIDGENVEVKVYKPKRDVKKTNRSKTTSICPECGSTLKVGEFGVWECQGDQLEHWHREFVKFTAANDERKAEILKSISDMGKFLDLYSRWQNAQELADYEFDCGYTNRIHSPNARTRNTIPDPIQVKRIERQLGRKLSEEELYNEDEIWQIGGRFLKFYKKGAKRVKIKRVAIPEDVM